MPPGVLQTGFSWATLEPVERIKEAAGERDVEVLKKRIIKPYSPGVYHVVVDAKIG